MDGIQAPSFHLKITTNLQLVGGKLEMEERELLFLANSHHHWKLTFLLSHGGEERKHVAVENKGFAARSKDYSLALSYPDGVTLGKSLNLSGFTFFSYETCINTSTCTVDGKVKWNNRSQVSGTE